MEDFPGGPVVKTVLPVKGALVRTRSGQIHVLYLKTEKKENKSDSTRNTIHNKGAAGYSETSFLQSPRTASGTY